MKKYSNFVWLATGLFTLILFSLCYINYRKDSFHLAKNNIPPLIPVVEPPFKDAYLHLADSLRSAGNFDSAFYHYRKAVSYYKKTGNKKGYVWALNTVGNTGIRSNRLEPAFEALQEALEFGTAKLGPNHRFTGNTYYYLGEYYYTKEEPEKALEAHYKALKIRHYLFGQDSKLVADSYQQIAQVYQYLLFNYAKAEACLDTVLSITEKFPDKDLAEIAGLYYDLAAINRLKGDPDKALLYANQYLLAAQKLKDPQTLEMAYSILGGIYNSRSDFPNTILHLKKAVRLNREYSSRNNTHNNLAYYYNDLGSAYQQIKRYEQAKYYLRKALKISSDKNTADSLVVSNSYASLGTICMQLILFDSASYYYQKCLQIRLAHFGKKHYKTALAYKNLGDLFLLQKQTDQALIYFQQAIIAGVPDFNRIQLNANPTVALIGTRYYLYEILSQKAVAFKQRYLIDKEDLSDLEQSLACYQVTDTLMDKYAQIYDLENSRLLLAKNSKVIYEQALDCVFLLSQTEKNDDFHTCAFHFMEKSKSQILLQNLRKAEELNETGVPDSVINFEKTLRFQMDHYQQQLETAMNKSKYNEDQVQKIRAKILDISLQNEKLEKVLERDFPNLFHYRYANETVRLPDVKKDLKNSSKQLLAYFWGDSCIYALGITDAKTRLIRIRRTGNFNRIFNDFLQSFTTVPTGTADKMGEQTAFTQYVKRANTLFNILIRPVLPADFRSDNNLTAYPDNELIIIPDGPLAYLPFNALISRLPDSHEINYRDLSYLLYQFRSSSAYSATLLKHNLRSLKKIQPKVLAFAFSSIPQNLEQSNFRTEVNNIPGSGRELDAIAGLMKGKFLKGKDATESKFKQYASDYDILHLAIHGNAGKENQYESRLNFNLSGSKGDDGYLYAHELYSLRLKARLVVLSACETGIGKFYTGEGVYSIARGFAYAGCPSLIMSLWKVDDNITADLMKDFYEGLSSGLPVNESMQLAQRHFLQNEDELNCNPRYWGAFIPLGDMRPVQSANPVFLLPLIGFLSLIGFLILFGSNLSQKIIRGFEKLIRS
ncbi:CHAT domain-containing protein [Dyadobacter sp. NIV53]|uniref:CHAT domain-containing protein n=1 Tax=Dyadobacter sp. NIV53 TaxID=2861765 RepID=UPI001C86C61A|nr:CHAT domain-containing protein [Dyadobacter sp. NIV53]